MKIGCVMISEGRAPIWGIALQSFLTQTPSNIDSKFEPDELVVDIGCSKLKDYLEYVPGKRLPIEVTCYNSDSTKAPVTRRLDVAICTLFDKGCDVVTMWDDDDYSPSGRLNTIEQYATDWGSSDPVVGSYGAGWFCNLRTLQGEYIRTMPAHLWGGTLTFNRAAWNSADGFDGLSMPGYDRQFVDAVMQRRSAKKIVFPCEKGLEPVAFSHGKNSTTWLKSKGEYLGDELRFWMPSAVFSEVKRASKFLVDHRVFPPQP